MTSKYEVMSFLGSTGYYASFIEDYATKARPLIDVLSRPGPDEAVIEFTDQERRDLLKSMNSLKLALTTAPTLAFADFSPKSSRFILDCDFSNKHGTIGCVLSQVQPPGSGCERVILYKAKSLRPSQKSYPPYKGIFTIVIIFSLHPPIIKSYLLRRTFRCHILHPEAEVFLAIKEIYITH